MKILEHQISKNGFTLTQIKRTGDVVLLESRHAANPNEKPQYEVCRVQHHNGREMFGVRLEPAEFLPSSAQWGQLGWSYMDIKSAQARFDQQVTRKTRAS